jgi:hypothetical protein
MQWRTQGFIWLDWVVDKISSKHNVEQEEVEETFFSRQIKVRKAESDKYLLYGRSSDGRYLFVVFTWVGPQVKVITARDMTQNERRFYARK